MLLPNVATRGPGVEALGFAVHPVSAALIRVDLADVAINAVASPWGPVTLAACAKVAGVTLVVSRALDRLWAIRAPLAVVLARLPDAPREWWPPGTQPEGGPAHGS